MLKKTMKPTKFVGNLMENIVQYTIDATFNKTIYNLNNLLL